MTKNEKLAALKSLFECAYQIHNEFGDDLVAANAFTVVGGAIAATMLRVKGENTVALKTLTTTLDCLDRAGNAIVHDLMAEIAAEVANGPKVSTEELTKKNELH